MTAPGYFVDHGLGDNTMDYDDDLAFVRHQLAGLIDARCMAELRPIDALRYQQLCERESELLRSRSSVAASNYSALVSDYAESLSS
jgi:hypothetical protein